MGQAHAAPSRSRGDRLHHLAFGALAAAPWFVRNRGRRAVFDRFYRGSADPWGYSRSPWEARRHAALVRACPPSGARWALDVGCGTGHLTRALLHADAARSIVGIDISHRAVRRAAHQSLSLPQGFRSQFLQVDIADDGRYWFTDRFDLVVCADVLYYLPRPQLLTQVLDRLVSWMRPAASLVLAHPVSHAAYLHGAAHSHAALRRTGSVHVAGTDGGYRIDVFTKLPSPR